MGLFTQALVAMDDRDILSSHLHLLSGGARRAAGTGAQIGASYILSKHPGAPASELVL